MFRGIAEVCIGIGYVDMASLTTQALSGGSNSAIICRDIGMTFERPRLTVVSRTMGPGSIS
jgi:hypothetical protein